VSDSDELPELKPLKIKCTASDCEAGLHCFRVSKKMAALNRQGQCRDCGQALVDWGRVHRRDLTDIEFTFRMLKLELIRHHFWHLELDARAMNHARRKGRVLLREAAAHMIEKKIAPEIPPFDGRQTAREGNSIFYAQHSVAACCRKCVEEWHGIPRGRELTPEEVGYLVGLICRWIDDRLPDLHDDPQWVEPLRKSLQLKGVSRGQTS